MVSVDTRISCQVCNKKFSNILLHLKRSLSCNQDYPLVAKQKLMKFCDAKTKSKKKLRDAELYKAKMKETSQVIVIIISEGKTDFI